MKKFKGILGFTLFELAIVMTISGLMLAFACQAYHVYVNQTAYTQTQSQMQTLQGSIGAYSDQRNKFPCPSDPSLPITDPNAGLEVCAYFQNTLQPPYMLSGTIQCNPAGAPFPNSQAGSLCVVPGGRHTLGNTGPTTLMDPVFIGGVPYASIKNGIEVFTSGCPDAHGIAPTPGGLGLPPPGHGPSPCTGTNVNDGATWGCVAAGTQTPDYCDVNNDGIIDPGMVVATSVPQVNGSLVWTATTSAGFDQASQSSIVDAWGYQLSYAVSGIMTNPNTYGGGQYGTINVQDENGVVLVSPPFTVQYVVISHGDDHSGAYNVYGKIINPCVSQAVNGPDWFNCNVGAPASNVVTAGAGNTFSNGIRSASPGATHVDDFIVSPSLTISSLWGIVMQGSVATNNIYNLNLGSIGIGQTVGAAPAQKLEVGGSIYVNADSGSQLQYASSSQTTECVPGSNYCVLATKLCDSVGANCIAPNVFGGYDATNINNPTNPPGVSTGSPPPNAVPSGNQCPAAPAGSVSVATSMAAGMVQCVTIPLPTPATNQPCASGLYATGFSSTGAIICSPP